jgi:hypothetical protein
MEQYLVWSHEHGLWWRANRAGYSGTVEGAGRYSRADAIEICAAARNGWPKDGPPSEIPVRLEDVMECSLPRVVTVRP